MVKRFIYWFELRTGIYLHPRFVVSIGLLLISIVIFSVISFLAYGYVESVKTTGPTTEKERAEYDVRMRTVHPTSPPSVR